MTQHWLELANQWFEVTRHFLWLDSDSTWKNFWWLWLEGLVTLTRQKWLGHITSLGRTYRKTALTLAPLNWPVAVDSIPQLRLRATDLAKSASKKLQISESEHSLVDHVSNCLQGPNTCGNLQSTEKPASVEPESSDPCAMECKHDGGYYNYGRRNKGVGGWNPVIFKGSEIQRTPKNCTTAFLIFRYNVDHLQILCLTLSKWQACFHSSLAVSLYGSRVALSSTDGLWPWCETSLWQVCSKEEQHGRVRSKTLKFCTASSTYLLLAQDVGIHSVRILSLSCGYEEKNVSWFMNYWHCLKVGINLLWEFLPQQTCFIIEPRIF